MSSGFTQLSPGAAVTSKDQQGTLVVPAAGVTDAVVLSFTTAPGLKGFVTSFRQAWDSALNTSIKFSLRINGVKYPPYVDLTNQIAAPEQDVDLPVPISVEQITLVEMVATATAAGNVFGRIIVKNYL